MSLPPSGHQFRLAAHGQDLVAVEVGGGIRAYRAGERDVLDGYADDAMCDGGRGQILAPWPNRLEDGSFEWGGRILQTALSEPENHNAIHGLVRWSPWALEDLTPESLRLSYRLHAQPGWPWTLDFAVTYRLSSSGLTVRSAATNQSDSACPFGLGWHPYLAAPREGGGSGLVDDIVLVVPASTALVSDERGLPTGEEKVPGDLRVGRRIGPAHIDQAFTGLVRDPDGRAVVSTDFGVKLWMDSSFRWVMVYTGDTLSDPSRRRRGLAVEPMTGPPNMLRSGKDRIGLPPGGRFQAEWGIDLFS